jgi:iron complex outermembrane receptor protein
MLLVHMVTTRIVAFLLFTGISSLAYTQKVYDIKGSIKATHTMEPVSGAAINCNGFNTISTVEGDFVLEKLPQGVYSIKVSHLGYGSKTFKIKLDGQTLPLQVLLEEVKTSLEEVVVYGKSERLQQREAPIIKVEASKAFLERNRENSLMQTLKKIPGVSTITIGSGQSKPLIRGLGFNRVSVIQNGIKHEAQQWGNDHGLEIDQYAIDRVQIIKGPASLLYGSDALAGVVNITRPSQPLPNPFSGSVNLLAETNNNLFGGSLGVSQSNASWWYRGRLTYRNYGDYKVPTETIQYESYIFELDKNNLRNTAGREANTSFSLGFTKGRLKSETFLSHVHAKNGFFANAHGLEVRGSTIDYDRSNRDIDLPYHLVDHFKLVNNSVLVQENGPWEVDFGFQHNHRQEHSEPVPHGYMPTPDHSLEREFTKNTLALNLKKHLKPNKNGHQLTFGLNSEGTFNNIGGWGFLIPAYNRYSLGGLVLDQWELNDQFHLQGGLRYDIGWLQTEAYYDWFPTPVVLDDGTNTQTPLQRSQNKNLFFGNFSASLGVSYLKGPTTLKLSLGKAFRMPLANELASDGVNYHMYRFEKGNLNLDPEVSYQVDVSFDHNAEMFRAHLSPFLNFFDNYIYLNPTPNYYETLQRYEYTQSQVFRMGGEISIGASLAKALWIDASLEYVYARQTNGPKKGFTLPFSPPLSGLFSASYQWPKGLWGIKNLRLNADYRITAAQNEIVPPEEKTEGYQVVHLSAMAQVRLFNQSKPVKLRLKCNNLFDTLYFDHTSFYRLIDVPEAGRNLSFSMTIPF